MAVLQKIYQQVKKSLEDENINTPALDARLLIQHALGLRHEDLVSRPDRELSGQDIQDIKALVRRRLKREPVSRILGVREFWGLAFNLSPDTLDPRPDSETLVESVLKNCDPDQPLKILDLGTGTGCLLLALLSELPQATGVGIDCLSGSIKTAKYNARQLGLSERCEFVHQSWADLVAGGPFDIVISNPPYIETNQIPKLGPEVKIFDPVCSLDGGEDGLDCYRDIIPRLKNWLSKTGFCAFEIGYTQSRKVAELLEKSGFIDSFVIQDLAGRNRCILAMQKKD